MTEAPFEVVLTRAAIKDLQKFRQWKPQIDDILSQLAVEPNLGKPLSGSLEGLRTIHFRIKGSGEARIAYVIRVDVRRCVVHAVGTRENFYEVLKRRGVSAADE